MGINVYFGLNPNKLANSNHLTHVMANSSKLIYSIILVMTFL